jgi:hypothetical protein
MVDDTSPAATERAELLAAIEAALEGADDDEAAAVAAAIGAHVRDQELAAAAAAAETDEGPNWAEGKWAFGSKLARKRRRSVRVRTDAPKDPWTAAGRADRM